MRTTKHTLGPRVVRTPLSLEWGLEWPNGSFSLMPDKETAKRCALAPEMAMFLVKAAVAFDNPENFHLDGMAEEARALLARLEDQS